MAYNVQDADVWAPIITRLADEAAGMLSPGKAVAFGNLDPRFYIKVGSEACGGLLKKLRESAVVAELSLEAEAALHAHA